MEACTITAPDVITAFAVPNPNHSSQSCRFFQVWRPSRLPCQADHPIYFGLAKFYLSQSFRSSTVRKLNGWSMVVNAAFRCKPCTGVRHHYEMKVRLECCGLPRVETQRLRFTQTFHNDLTNCAIPRK